MSAPAPEVDLPPNPARPARRAWRRARKALLITAGLLVLLLAGLGAAGALLLHRFDNAVNRATLLGPETRVVPATTVAHAPLTGPLNFLLLGSDLRVDDPDEGQRSDTIIVGHIPRTLDHVYLVSIPRDLRVEIPAESDLNFSGDYTKINAAFEYGHGGTGGARLVSSTLTQLIGIRFDGAAAIDFTGMAHVVDVLGGVTMCVESPVISIHPPYRAFNSGCQTMGSAEVLDYLRQRAFPDGDFSRQRHQQEFLKAVFDKLFTAGTLSNPVRLDALLQGLASSLTVDLGGTSIPDLLFALRGLSPGDVTGIKIPHYLTMDHDTSYVMASDEADGLFQALREDSLDAWTAGHSAWVNPI